MAAFVTMLPLIVACQVGGTPESRIDRLQLDAAREAERRCDWAAAAAEYGALYAADPPAGNVGLAFARSLRRAGRYGEAQDVVGQVLEKGGRRADLLVEQGRVRIAAGQAEQALAPLAEAARLEPGNADAQGVLAIAYDRLNRPQEAEAAYRRALALAPGDPRILNNYALSRAYAGDLDRALGLMQEAVAAAAAAPPSCDRSFRLNLDLLQTLKRGSPAAVSAPTAPAAKTKPGPALD